MAECSCSGINTTILRQLNQDYTGDLGAIHQPVTALLYLSTVILCFLLVIITQLKYNSIEVLNLIVRTKSISNLTWIIFFLFVTLRSLIYTAVYCIDEEKKNDVVLEGVFISGWILKSFETMLLCVSLNYQRKYRSGALIDAEVNRFNKKGKKEKISFIKAAKKIILSQETIFVIHFLITSLLLILTDRIPKQTCYLFFTFVSVLWSQSLAAIILCVLIVIDGRKDGPTTCTKVIFSFAVFFSLPSLIPNVFWTCTLKQTSQECLENIHFTPYDISVFSSLISYILLFVALRAEFVRLDQESRWAVVGAVQSMFNVKT